MQLDWTTAEPTSTAGARPILAFVFGVRLACACGVWGLTRRPRGPGEVLCLCVVKWEYSAVSVTCERYHRARRLCEQLGSCGYRGMSTEW